ncbi:hypothetical protein CHU92_00090, partial [Flavobacterium cyanobacteriorum]
SLGADLGEFLLKRARTSAKNALEYEAEIRKAAKKEGIEDVDGLIDDIKKIADGGDNPNFSVINKKIKDYWTKFLTKKGVKIEIGTEEANRILNVNFADGLFVRKGYDPVTNQFKEQIIYLKSNPSTSAFLEESYHALQSIEGVEKYKDVIYKGIHYKNIDYWEFLAKKRILEEAKKNGISYEEYIFVEKQLYDVLNKKY